MQLHIEHKLASELVLPINYNHILQSILYNALKGDESFAKRIHEQGYQNKKRSYKMFQFSQLKGKYRVQQKKIIFMDSVSFEVRSPDERILNNMREHFLSNGISYGMQHFDEVSVRLENKTIEQPEIVIKMVSPLTVHTTDKITKKTMYYRPDCERFRELINDNFERKYEAYTREKPLGMLEFEPVSFREKDKVVTRYKGFYICGWLGTYRLKGDEKYLDFVYQTGLGDRNSQGFGMFETIERGCKKHAV